MSNPWRIEAALQRWQPWLESLRKARLDLEFRPDFTGPELVDWEKKVGWRMVWRRAPDEIDAMILPRTLSQYWIACFRSQYDPAKPQTYYRIKLPEQVSRVVFTEGISGSSLFVFEGSRAWSLEVKGGEVKTVLKVGGGDERILPPFPLELGVPCTLGFPLSVGTREVGDALPIIKPPWTKVVSLVSSDLDPPEMSPYITVRIPVFALGYSQILFKQLNLQLKVIAEWLRKNQVHPLQSEMKRGRPVSYYREWAIEQIAEAPNKTEAMTNVCKILLLIEKKKRATSRGRSDSDHDLTERSEKVMKATVRRRVQKWLKQGDIRLR